MLSMQMTDNVQLTICDTGVKAGLKRTYNSVTQEQLDITNMPQWRPLFYAVAFLHTTVQVRTAVN